MTSPHSIFISKKKKKRKKEKRQRTGGCSIWSWTIWKSSDYSKWCGLTRRLEAHFASHRLLLEDISCVVSSLCSKYKLMVLGLIVNTIQRTCVIGCSFASQLYIMKLEMTNMHNTIANWMRLDHMLIQHSKIARGVGSAHNSRSKYLSWV